MANIDEEKLNQTNNKDNVLNNQRGAKFASNKQSTISEEELDEINKDTLDKSIEVLKVLNEHIANKRKKKVQPVVNDEIAKVEEPKNDMASQSIVAEELEEKPETEEQVESEDLVSEYSSDNAVEENVQESVEASEETAVNDSETTDNEEENEDENTKQSFFQKILGWFGLNKKKENNEEDLNKENEEEKTDLDNNKAIKQEAQEPKNKKALFGFGKTKKTDSNKEYKPPFYQTFKFWVVIVILVGFLIALGFIIYSSVKNASPKLPTQGFMFETRESNGVYTEKDDLLVFYADVSDSIDVKVSFRQKFSGSIKLSISNTQIASLSTDVVQSGGIVRITPQFYENSRELIGGTVTLTARYQSVISNLSILIDKRLTSISVTADITQKDKEAFSVNQQLKAQLDSMYDKNNNLKWYYVDRDVKLSAKGAFGHTNTNFENDDFGRILRWTSRNQDIATIDENTGKITSYKAGVATFSVSTQENYTKNPGPAAFNRTANIEIEFRDIPVNGIRIENISKDASQTLWLSNANEQEVLEINLADIISIAVDGSKVPNDFKANYMFRNAEFINRSENNNAVLVNKIEGYNGENVSAVNVVNKGNGIFELYDYNYAHETRDGVNGIDFDFSFGMDENGELYHLRRYGGKLFNLSIKRNKNYLLHLDSELSSQVEVENIAFDVRNPSGGITTSQYYSSGNYYDLLTLFPLQILPRETDITEVGNGNNFDIYRDVVFEPVGDTKDYFKIETINGKYYFVPGVDTLSDALNSSGFQIKAYLKDINKIEQDENGNNKYAEIPNSAIGVNNTKVLTVKVVKPSAEKNSINFEFTNTPLSVKSGEDVANQIYQTISNVLINIEGNSTRITVMSDLFSMDNDNRFTNEPAPRKFDFVLEPLADMPVTVSDKTKISLNQDANPGYYQFRLTIYYTYNVEASSVTPRNRVEIFERNLTINVTNN